MKSFDVPRINTPIRDSYHAMLIDSLNRQNGFVVSIAEELINLLNSISNLKLVNFNDLSQEEKHIKIVTMLSKDCPIAYKILVEKKEIIPANIILFKVAQLSRELAVTLNIDEFIN